VLHKDVHIKKGSLLRVIFCSCGSRALGHKLGEVLKEFSGASVTELAPKLRKRVRTASCEEAANTMLHPERLHFKAAAPPSHREAG
jgi:hypothetical protein